LGEILLPDDPFVSARHCELEATARGIVLRDLGSSNGTFLQAELGSESELLPGDTFRLGRNILRIEQEHGP
jgi:pSer/pThr/pTyr-binding forkhead associated (FHA) protein